MYKYKNFSFRTSKETGGKAGKGKNVTTSIHVVNVDLAKGRYFSYHPVDPCGYGDAKEKARKWIDKILSDNK